MLQWKSVNTRALKNDIRRMQEAKMQFGHVRSRAQKGARLGGITQNVAEIIGGDFLAHQPQCARQWQ